MKESWPLPDHLLQIFTSWNWVCIAYLSGIGSAFLTFSSSSAIRSNFHWRRLERTRSHVNVLDISSYLYCQTPRQKVEIGAITNIAPATFESIQLSLATPLGTCSYCK